MTTFGDSKTSGQDYNKLLHWYYKFFFFKKKDAVQNF